MSDDHVVSFVRREFDLSGTKDITFLSDDKRIPFVSQDKGCIGRQEVNKTCLKIRHTTHKSENERI